MRDGGETRTSCAGATTSMIAREEDESEREYEQGNDFEYEYEWEQEPEYAHARRVAPRSAAEGVQRAGEIFARTGLIRLPEGRRAVDLRPREQRLQEFAPAAAEFLV